MDKEPAQRGSHPLAYRIEDAAAAIGIGRSTMFEFIKDGQIPARKIGNSTVIRHRDLEAFLDAAPLSAATRNAQRAKGISLGSAAPDKLVIRGADEVTGTSPQASRSEPMTDPGRSVVPFQVAARELGLNAATLRRMCKDGRGPILLRLSERRLGIRKRDLDAWLESRGIVPGSGGGAKIRFRERKG